MNRPKKLTREQQIARAKFVQEQREKQAEQERVELEIKSRKFRKGPLGIIIKLFALAGIIGAVCLLVDRHLGIEYYEMPIHNSIPETVEVIDRSGYVYPAVFQHVYLGDQGQMELFVHERTIQPSLDSGSVYVGKTKIYEDVLAFHNPGETTAYGLYLSSFWSMIFPITVIFFSLLALIMNPKWNVQTYYWAFLNTVLMPLLFVIISFHAFTNWSDNGSYEMNIRDPDATHNILEVPHIP